MNATPGHVFNAAGEVMQNRAADFSLVQNQRRAPRDADN